MARSRHLRTKWEKLDPERSKTPDSGRFGALGCEFLPFWGSVEQSGRPGRTRNGPPPEGEGPSLAENYFSSESAGFSTTDVSVVSSSDAMDAAFASAERVTLTGSMTPSANRSTYWPVAAL